MLFSHLCVEKFEFAEKENKTVVLKTPDLMRRNPGHVKRSFTIACHKVCIRAKIYKDPQLVAEESQVDMLGESLDLRLERDNSVLAKDIKVREFVFSEADHEILCEYKELKTIYVFFGQKYLNYVYIRAESAASNHLNLDMKDGITSMVKKLSPNTINQYGVGLERCYLSCGYGASVNRCDSLSGYVQLLCLHRRCARSGGMVHIWVISLAAEFLGLVPSIVQQGAATGRCRSGSARQC